MATVLGMDAVINYQTDGVGGSAGWVELTNVRELTRPLESATADVTTRAGNGWRQTVATLKDGSVEFTMIYDTSDAGFTAIRTAFFDNTTIGFQILDGDPGEGLEADFIITGFSIDEALEEAMTVTVTAQITRSTTAPAWVDTTP